MLCSFYKHTRKDNRASHLFTCNKIGLKELVYASRQTPTMVVGLAPPIEQPIAKLFSPTPTRERIIIIIVIIIALVVVDQCRKSHPWLSFASQGSSMLYFDSRASSAKRQGSGHTWRDPTKIKTRIGGCGSLFTLH